MMSRAAESRIVVRRARGGWAWVVLYLDHPESSGWEELWREARRQARIAQRLLRPKTKEVA